MNNTTIESKNALEGINSRITKAEEQISDLEDRMVEITAMEQDKEKNLALQDSAWKAQPYRVWQQPRITD